jgi:ribosomal protein S18 acetylase RimI-like enzyme
MRVRPFRLEDESEVVALWRAAGLLTNPLNDPARDIRFCRESRHGEVLVGEDDGRVVAAVMVGHDGHRGWLWYLGVSPQLQGHGLGRAMTKAAEAWLAARGVPKVELLVRDSNTRAVGFYQRLGYVQEPRALLAKRLDGREPREEPVTITYLEMRARPDAAAPRAPDGAALLRAEPCTLAYYRYLYDAVGRPWLWTDRKTLSDAQLAAILDDPRVEVWTALFRGVPAGYFELDSRRPAETDLAYFGLMPEFIGRRLGPWLLGCAIARAWSDGLARLTVNTCTLDHPRALPLYRSMGFSVCGRREVKPSWARAEIAAE